MLRGKAQGLPVRLLNSEKQWRSEDILALRGCRMLEEPDGARPRG
jgi:hypothetical protein